MLALKNPAPMAGVFLWVKLLHPTVPIAGESNPAGLFARQFLQTLELRFAPHVTAIVTEGVMRRSKPQLIRNTSQRPIRLRRM